jgi:hypothetical protein
MICAGQVRATDGTSNPNINAVGTPNIEKDPKGPQNEPQDKGCLGKARYYAEKALPHVVLEGILGAAGRCLGVAGAIGTFKRFRESPLESPLRSTTTTLPPAPERSSNPEPAPVKPKATPNTADCGTAARKAALSVFLKTGDPEKAVKAGQQERIFCEQMELGAAVMKKWQAQLEQEQERLSRRAAWIEERFIDREVRDVSPMPREETQTLLRTTKELLKSGKAQNIEEAIEMAQRRVTAPKQ